MGAMFGVSVITPGAVGAGAAAAVIRAAATAGPGARPKIRRITLVIHASPNTSAIDVYRVPVGNIGTPNVSVIGQGYVAAEVSATNVDTAWSAAPSLPASPVRIDGCSLLGTLGNGAILQFVEPLVLEPNTGLLLWSTLAGAQLRITPVWEE